VKTAADDFWAVPSDWEGPSAVDLAPGAPRAVLLSFADFARFQAVCNNSLWRLLTLTFRRLLSEGLLDREELLAELAACKEEQDELMTLEGVMGRLSRWRERETKDKQDKPPAWTPEVIAGDGAEGEKRDDGTAKHGARKRGTRERPALRSVVDKSNRGKKGEKA
jgi:hypothetical protein